MTIAPLLVLALALGPAAITSSDAPAIELVVRPETPLRIALDERVRLRYAGQIVTGTLARPVYAYDRVVAPAGTRVFGHVSKLTRISGGRRLSAMANGDFTPLRDAVLEFDLLVLPDGREIPIETEVRSVAPSSVLRVRETPGKKTAPREAAPLRKRPGKVRRLGQWLVERLPYHPQYLAAGTVYTAVLLEPLSFGTVEPTEPAPAGTLPPPDSVLRARLVTALDSSKTPRGSAVRAVVTEPLFSEDHRLILPEGTVLGGEVTLARPAGRFHRNGQLRFLFETVQAPEEESPEGLQASLHAVEGVDPRLALDDEGGARMTRSKTRFVAPALSGLALGLSLHRRWDYDTDGLGPEAQYGTAESKGLGGFFGAGLIGAGLSQASRPVSIGFGIAGLLRTLFLSVAGRGRDVSFPVHTPIEVELATAAEGAR
jgi:hypothetical protein